MKNNPLIDNNFLNQLLLDRNKEIFAKIILLTFEEEPVQEIQGKITSGSINIDGASAVRRTCSLTMVSNEHILSNFYWGLKNKFQLFIGVTNHIDSEYPDIIWFPQGYYVITSLNETNGVGSYQISISGKDKMCLLNGEVGGSLTASVDFGKIDEYTKETGGEIIKNTTHLTITQIIKNAVHAFGQEKMENIIINDVDNYGLELLEYRGSQPLYIFLMGDQTSNATFDGTKKVWYDGSGSEGVQISKLSLSKDFNFDNLFQTDNGSVPTKIALSQPNENDDSAEKYPYTLMKIEQYDAAGYRLTDLTYPGDLIANVGESLTSILDKIKNTFGNFEYFYDLNGRFVFQEKKNYVNKSWNNLNENENSGKVYANQAAYSSSHTFSFNNNMLISNFANTPNILNVKNDFSIWGTRTSASGAELPIHLRYAVQKKPEYYRPYDGGEAYTAEEHDWRELIYQMSLDYFKYNHIDENFSQKIAENNPNHYPKGITGYEAFYTDMQSFWRKIYDPDKGGFVEAKTKAPYTLDFWIDFMDTNGDFAKYSISAIGNRPKAINNKDVKALYYKGIPNIMFFSKEKKDDIINYSEFAGYRRLILPNSYYNYFTISARGKTAQDELDNLLYQHLHFNENVTLTTIPVYHLQPNTRIVIEDDTTQINGEYIVNKITIPLGYNGTSSISAIKAVDRIY